MTLPDEDWPWSLRLIIRGIIFCLIGIMAGRFLTATNENSSILYIAITHDINWLANIIGIGLMIFGLSHMMTFKDYNL